MEPEQVSDAELIVRVRSGDASAMGELYARHHEAALRVARATSRDAHLADDLVSSAFERIQGAISRGAGPVDSFRAYLYTVIRRLAVEAGILRSREEDTADWTPHEAAMAVQHGEARSLEAQLVAKAFGTLPERQQAVLWYLEVEGLTPLQAAPLFDLTPNATSALAVRARDALRSAYIQAHVSDHPVHEHCAPTRRRMGAYLRSATSAREAAKIEAHLLECDECPLVLEELKDVGYGLKSVFAPLLLGGGVLGGVLSAIGGGGDAAMATGLAGGSGGPGGHGASRSLLQEPGTKVAVAAISVLAVLGVTTVVSAAVNAVPAAPIAAPLAADVPAPAGRPTPSPTPPVPVPPPVAAPPAPDAPAPDPEAPPPAPAEPAAEPAPSVEPPPVAALDLQFTEDEQLPGGEWAGRVIATVTNSNPWPADAALRLSLPPGVALDGSRAPEGIEAWDCGVLAVPVACTAAGIPPGAVVRLAVPVIIAADALGARPVASLSVTRP